MKQVQNTRILWIFWYGKCQGIYFDFIISFYVFVIFYHPHQIGIPNIPKRWGEYFTHTDAEVLRYGSHEGDAWYSLMIKNRLPGWVGFICWIHIQPGFRFLDSIVWFNHDKQQIVVSYVSILFWDMQEGSIVFCELAVSNFFLCVFCCWLVCWVESWEEHREWVVFFVRVSVRLVISYFSEAYHSSGNPLSKWKVINIYIYCI